MLNLGNRLVWESKLAGARSTGAKATGAIGRAALNTSVQTQQLVRHYVEPMKVRIRFELGPKVKRAAEGVTPAKNRHVASAMGALLVPVTVMAFVFFAWRLSSDLGLTTEFPIDGGLFSHWQVWLGLALVSQLGTILLSRYGKSGETGFSDIVVRLLGDLARPVAQRNDRGN